MIIRGIDRAVRLMQIDEAQVAWDIARPPQLPPTSSRWSIDVDHGEPIIICGWWRINVTVPFVRGALAYALQLLFDRLSLFVTQSQRQRLPK